MGLHEAMIPMSFVVVCICAIALASININTAFKLPAEKRDNGNFNFSIMILVAGIIGLGISGYFTYASFKAPSAEELDPTLAKLDGMFENLRESAPKPANFSDPTKLRNLEAAEAELTGKVQAITSEVAAYQQSLAARLEEVKAAVKQKAMANAAAAAQLAATTASSG
jgi:hypothetical protein